MLSLVKTGWRVGLCITVEGLSSLDTQTTRFITFLTRQLAGLGVTLATSKSKVKMSYCRHVRAKGERYSSYSFLISTLDGGEWSKYLPGRALALGKGQSVPI